MADTMSVSKTNHESVKKESQLIAILKRLASNKLAMFGLFVLIAVVLAAIFAPILAPYSPDYIDRNAFNQRASVDHLLGTDVMGRDLLSRLIYGARYSLGLSFSSVLLSLVCGVFVGAIAGYFGGAVDQVYVIVSFFYKNLLCPYNIHPLVLFYPILLYKSHKNAQPNC